MAEAHGPITECVVIEKLKPLRLVCPRALHIRCTSGTAWITTDGDLRDVVLGPGQVHAAARGDRLFINGMPDCQLQLARR